MGTLYPSRIQYRNHYAFEFLGPGAASAPWGMTVHRHRFGREESAWIATQQLHSLRRDRPRTPDLWQSLYVAFLAQFPKPPGAQVVTQQQYKAHFLYLDKRTPQSQLVRIQQHLREYEERSKERRRQRRRRREEEAQAQAAVAAGDEQEQEEPEEEDEEEEEVIEALDSEEIEMEMRIKTEASTAVEAPRAAPLPLLRTKATADAARRESDFSTQLLNDLQQSSRVQKLGVRHRTTFGMYDETPPAMDPHSAGPTEIVRPSRSVVEAVTAKRQRVDTKHPTGATTQHALPGGSSPVVLATATVSRSSVTTDKLKTVETQLRAAKQEAQQWKDKYNTTAVQLAREKSQSKVLQSRLDEALAKLQATQKKLQRAKRAKPLTVSVGGAAVIAQAPTSFTIRLKVDLTPNDDGVEASSQDEGEDGSSSPAFH